MDKNLTIQLRILTSGVEKLKQVQSEIDKTASKTTGNFGKMTASMETFGSKLNVMGQRLTWMVSVPLLVFGNKAVETAIEVERTWLRLEKVFDGTAEDLGTLKTAAWDIAKTYGVSFEEATDAITEFSKAGITSKDDLAALGDMTAKTSILFDTDMTSALNGVKSIMFGFGLTVEQTKQELAAINIVADKTTASESAVLAMLSRMAGTARAAGFSIREVAAAQAVFEANAIPAGRAGNALKSILTALTKQSNLAKDQFDELGLSMTSVEWKTSSGSEKLQALAEKMVQIKSTGDKDVLKKFNDQVGELSAELGNDFEDGPIDKLKLLKAAITEAESTGNSARLTELNAELSKISIGGNTTSEKLAILEENITALESAGRTVEMDSLNEALASLVGKFQINNLNVLLQDLAKNFDDNAETSSIFAEAMGLSNDGVANLQHDIEQLNKVLESEATKMDIANQKFKEAEVILGEKLLPIKMKILEILTNLVNKFNELSPGTQDFILKILGLVVVFGPLAMGIGIIISALGFLFSGIGSVTSGFMALNAVTKGAAALSAPTAIGIGLISVALIALATTAVVMAVNSYNNLQETLKGLKVQNDETKLRIERTSEALMKVPDGPFKEKMAGMIEKNKELVKEAERLQERYSGMKGAGNAIYDWAMETESLFGRVADAAVSAFDKMKKAVGYAKDKSMKGVGKFFEDSFSGGGIVYASNGFVPKGVDTLPAMLSPGEMVINKTQQGNLFDMLQGRTQPAMATGGVTVNINVSGNMIASRGEQRAFARTIKELLEEDNNRR